VRTSWALAIFALGAASGLAAQPNGHAGQGLYAVCAGCHGFAGEGQRLVQAPRLAGLDPWYVARQMHSFTAGGRGYSADDVHGTRMATMAKAARGERDIADLLSYLATLPVTKPPPTLPGDVDSGRRLYAVCAACHGQDGAGREDTSAPGLAGLDDWYIVAQLELYAAGLRGAQADDTYGQQMRAMSSLFADDATRRDLAAYIGSLAP
jgi:cytochrome c oxidase subunit II